MSEHNAFERQLADEIEYEVGPPRNVDATAITRQAQTSSPHRRFTTMSSTIKFAAAAGILGVVGAALFLVMPGSPAPDDGVVAPPGAEDASASPPEASPLDWGALEPGTYVDDTFMGPELRFSVGEGWRVLELYDGLIQLSWGGTGQQYLVFQTFDGRANVAHCYMPDDGLEGDLAALDFLSWTGQPENLMTVGSTQDDLWNHLASNPHLEIGERAEVQVGEHIGQQADVNPSIGDSCFEDRTMLWYGPHGWIVDLENEEQTRLTTLEMQDDVLVLDARTAAGVADHEAFLAAADELIGTLTITETFAE